MRQIALALCYNVCLYGTRGGGLYGPWAPDSAPGSDPAAPHPHAVQLMCVALESVHAEEDAGCRRRRLAVGYRILQAYSSSSSSSSSSRSSSSGSDISSSGGSDSDSSNGVGSSGGESNSSGGGNPCVELAREIGFYDVCEALHASLPSPSPSSAAHDADERLLVLNLLYLLR